MINLIEKLIIKKGWIWRIAPGFFQNLLDGLNLEVERIRDYLKIIVRESNPGTAIDTQEEWYQQYALPYNETKSIEEKQAETLERYIALGDQDIVYLQAQVYKAGFYEIILIENAPPDPENSNVCGEGVCGEAECWNGNGIGPKWIFYYYVNGEVDTDDELIRLKDLLQKNAPGHLTPIFNVNSSNNVCGEAVCGEAVCDG